jgi:hypothetical protein
MAVGAAGAVVEVFPGGIPPVTMSGGAAITAGRLVEMSGDRTVQHAGAASLKVAGANGQVSALAAAAAATLTDINNARAVIGVALAAISNGQTGPVLLKIAG